MQPDNCIIMYVYVCILILVCSCSSIYVYYTDIYAEHKNYSKKHRHPWIGRIESLARLGGCLGLAGSSCCLVASIKRVSPWICIDTYTHTTQDLFMEMLDTSPAYGNSGHKPCLWKFWTQAQLMEMLWAI